MQNVNEERPVNLKWLYGITALYVILMLCVQWIVERAL